jgi:hypothetical protein
MATAWSLAAHTISPGHFDNNQKFHGCHIACGLTFKVTGAAQLYRAASG